MGYESVAYPACSGCPKSLLGFIERNLPRVGGGLNPVFCDQVACHVLDGYPTRWDMKIGEPLRADVAVGACIDVQMCPRVRIMRIIGLALILGAKQPTVGLGDRLVGEAILERR